MRTGKRQRGRGGFPHGQGVDQNPAARADDDRQVRQVGKLNRVSNDVQIEEKLLLVIKHYNIIILL